MELGRKDRANQHTKNKQKKFITMCVNERAREKQNKKRDRVGFKEWEEEKEPK